MDILIRLRLLLWAMVIGLWGLMVYQLLEEDNQDAAKMKWVAKQVPQEEESLPQLEDQPRIPADQLFPAKPETEDLTHPASPVPGTQTGAKLARIPSSLGTALPGGQAAAAFEQQPSGLLARPPTEIGRVQPAPLETKAPARQVPPQLRQPVERPPERPPESPAAPKGFVKSETRHFVVYAESQSPSLEFLETLENLHANLMLDLAAFSPWARDEKVSIFLFRSQDSYRKVTGRPAWSGGASSVKRRKIYIYESEELVGILAHELTHIYFDSFFLSAGGNPLWLSEGMATLVQTERGLAAPNWLAHNLAILKRGGGYRIGDLIGVEDTSKASDDDIRLWYTQAYSVVRFLIRSQYRSSFYKFCRALRDGAVVDDALYKSYGMPFNRVKALEYAWRYDLEQGKM